MRITRTAIPDLIVLEPEVFRDERGMFLESFNQRSFDKAVGRHIEFVQDNHSHSRGGVLRGLHYQVSPYGQGKLVRVVSGSVFDVAVDLRKSSSTFGRWVGAELSESNHRQLWIPAGFAHGFLVTSASADFLYKATAYYEPAAERTVRYDDPTLAIQWPLLDQAPVLSRKDAAGAALKDCELP